MVYIVYRWGYPPDDDEDGMSVDWWTFYSSRKEAEKVLRKWKKEASGGGNLYRNPTPRTKAEWIRLMNEPGEAEMVR
jgi:hypothetical protein